VTAPEAKSWSVISGQAPESREKAASEFVDAQMAFAAPRRLMAALRDSMAGDAPVAEKLNHIVSLIARELRTDACSCFILRAGEVLELYCNTGFNKVEPSADAPQKPKLRVGEGVIGDIAASATPITLPDITQHPQYIPRPENGLGAFKSFCGVPILRGGSVRGVLTVQTRALRSFGEDVTEILQTVAMLLAEIIVAEKIVSRLEMNSGYAAGGKPTHIGGASFSRGLAIGKAVLYDPALSADDIVADDTKLQKKRLSEALASMHDAIDRMLHRNAGISGSETRDILEAYQMFAKDRGWLARIEATIEKGLTAEAAVQRVQGETRARMIQLSDAYIRERLGDLEDLSNRLLSHLIRQHTPETPGEMPDNIILVARTLGPAALLDYDHTRLKAVVLEKGSYSNHVSIVARSLGIPVVGQCGDVSNFIINGDTVIVDGDQGAVHISPPEYVTDLYTRNIEAKAQRSTLYRRSAHRPCVTKDGTKISVMINAGLLAEVAAVQSVAADGIGLFRSELSFMGWKKYPLVITQAELYGKIMDGMAGKPVVFRTLDIGGDKPLPYFTPPAEEENPALGWRAIRIGMDRPAVLRTQFRAFIRGAQGRELRIMLPFVSEVAEFDRARQLLEMEKTRARQNKQPVPEKIDLGVMLEVPSLLFQLDSLLEVADFVSVGTNDLMQYLFAADRCNHAMRNRYDALSPPMLQALKFIADTCKAAGKPVSVCGEMAGQPLEAMVLIALGFDTLSVPAQSVEAVKTMVPTVDIPRMRPYLDQLMASREHSLRARIASFARDHNVNILQSV
jgi:phosphotransferase system, enzyme I, PtsP